VLQVAPELPEALAEVPKPGPGVAESSLAAHSAGAVLKAEQIVANRLAESLAEEIVSPLITKVGEP